ncbi:pentapeptide repeat-containing protein [Mycolicibacterium peregrinum]|nr:pentapeptide repeat-containing protein [Mycolicibacterium peregrinum]
MDLRGLTIDEPERSRVNENVDRISKVYEFNNLTIRDVDLSHAVLPEWRVVRSSFTNCVFNASTLPSLRTYSATFIDCFFRNASMREASLGAQESKKNAGGVYAGCDFTGADLRDINTDQGRFANCIFAGTRWSNTRTLTAVFENCDFRDAEISEVFFDGRRFDSKGPAGLGENKLKGCDFSTSRLESTSFLAIDFRNLIPPRGEQYVLVTDFPRRVEIASDRLKANGSGDASWLALRYKMEFAAAKFLPKDATGMLDFGGLSDADAKLLAAVFELDH